MREPPDAGNRCVPDRSRRQGVDLGLALVGPYGVRFGLQGTSEWPSARLPEPPPTGPRAPHCKRPHIESVVVGKRRTGTPSQFCLEFVGHPASARLSFERLPAPLDRHRTQCFVGQLLLCCHEYFFAAVNFFFDANGTPVVSRESRFTCSSFVFHKGLRFSIAIEERQQSASRLFPERFLYSPCLYQRRTAVERQCAQRR